MNRAIEIQLIEACRQHKANKTTSLGAGEEKSEVSKYVSASRFQLEQEKVFKQLPSILLHSSELQENDSFQPVSSPLGNLIATRDKQGKAHVFYNACRHRGAQLVTEKACAKRMVCPYHAWSYATDGSLSNVPGQAHCFPELNKADNGLIEIPSIEKYGFIWVCPQAKSKQEAPVHLDQHLGDMTTNLQWLDGARLKFYQRNSKVWNGNWKLFAEGGLETYHFAFAHRDTIASSFYNNTAAIDQIDQHFRVIMPTRELEVGQPQSLHDCSHTLFYLMPNSVLLVQKAHTDWILLRPIAADKTEIIVTSLIPDSADLSDEKQANHWRKNHHITNLTLDEDWELGQSIQTSISDGALPHIQYGKNEWALHRFNENLNQILDE